MGGSIKNNSRIDMDTTAAHSHTHTHTHRRQGEGEKTFPNVLALVFCVIGHVATAQKGLGLHKEKIKRKETDAEIPR